ncbi:MAG: UDP-2,4-diacetamido-2,4,6-trideoxy-beta-L-altropyranose hydrolase [Verrucomicrobia bacterium]|nr:UDP-2,4-diacetamido-2,4,6-trideoxy-beta-L-altropyranose hydrolase [Verrucomicrobiota bacterium]
MTPPLLIRADGGAALGTGHVMRCLALAQPWLRAGGRAAFAQARPGPALVERLRTEGVESLPISAAPGSPEDALQTVNHATALGCAWIVADGYAFGTEWQRLVKAAGFRLLVLDDYGHAGRYHADLILNQNAGASAALYAARDGHTALLLGSRYALLRGEFSAVAGTPRAIAERAAKVLVTLGGSDPAGVTETVVAALAQLPGIEAVVVVGGSNPRLASIHAAVAAGGGALRVVVDAPNMAELMVWADVAVSAAGSTAWELACLGLPSALIVVADNQTGIAAALEREGVSLNLGSSVTLDAARIDGDSWSGAFLGELKGDLEKSGHTVRWIHDPKEIGEGDVAFFLSLGRIVPRALLRRHAHNLVVHASALPHGRGWSPLTWQILEGRNAIPVSLLEAADGVDTGDIYAQQTLQFQGTELLPEMHRAVADATTALCRDFIARYPFSCADRRAQSGEPSYSARRCPVDSRLDPDRTLRDQFNLLRVCDQERYPAFLEIAGRRYEVRLTPVAETNG